MNTFGHFFRLTTWGESHGPGIGAVIDGCPPGVGLAVPSPALPVYLPWLKRSSPSLRREA